MLKEQAEEIEEVTYSEKTERENVKYSHSRLSLIELVTSNVSITASRYEYR